MALGDQVGKQSVDAALSHLPEIEAFIDDQLAKIRATVAESVKDGCDTIRQTTGEALAAVTAERTEAINQAEAAAHGILDRVGAMKLQIPPRVGNDPEGGSV